MKREMVLGTRDFKNKEMHAMKKILTFLKKAQAGFGGFEHELLKKLHYELWNAEIRKIRSRFSFEP